MHESGGGSEKTKECKLRPVEVKMSVKRVRVSENAIGASENRASENMENIMNPTENAIVAAIRIPVKDE